MARTKQAGHSSSNHSPSKCHHLPEEDHKYIAKALQIANIFNNDLDDSSQTVACADNRELYYVVRNLDHGSEPAALFIQTYQSPYDDTFHAYYPVHITVSATGNMIHHSLVTYLGCHVTPSSQSAHKVDGSSSLKHACHLPMAILRILV